MSPGGPLPSPLHFDLHGRMIKSICLLQHLPFRAPSKYRFFSGHQTKGNRKGEAMCMKLILGLDLISIISHLCPLDKSKFLLWFKNLCVFSARHLRNINEYKIMHHDKSVSWRMKGRSLKRRFSMASFPKPGQAWRWEATQVHSGWCSGQLRQRGSTHVCGGT